MNTNKIIVIAMVALMAVPAVAYANHAFTAEYKSEQVVEGHTVYAILTAEYDEDVDNRSDQGTAVAVLVRERICQANRVAVDGVLWFNDQFLVGSDEDAQNDICYFRYPCFGTVYAVNAGMPNPIRLDGTWVTPAAYAHSYRITDPNDHVWIIDYWTLTAVPGAAGSVWTVNLQGIMNDGSGTVVNNETERDDGTSDCLPYTDATLHETSIPATTKRSGQYPDIDYNAVLFMLWRHIVVEEAGGKEYGNTTGGVYGANADEDTAKPNCTDTEAGNCDSANPQDDPMPSGGYNDDWEGNSHPWNPYPMDGGVDNGPNHTHETGRVDIYYVPVERPMPVNDVLADTNTNLPGFPIGFGQPARRYYINDLQGSNQCFHEHGSFSQPACFDGDPRSSAYFDDAPDMWTPLDGSAYANDTPSHPYPDPNAP